MRIRLFGQYIHCLAIALCVLDGVLFFVAFHAAAFLRFGEALLIEQQAGALAPRALLLSLTIVVSQFALGLYSTSHSLRGIEVPLRQGTAVSVGAAVLALAAYATPTFHVAQGTLVLAMLLCALSAVLTRILFQQLIDRDFLKRRVVVYGCGRRAAILTQCCRDTTHCGCIIVGYVPPPNEVPGVSPERLLHPSESLRELCKQLHATEIVVAMEDRRQGLPLAELLECRLDGVEITELPTFLERETGRVTLDVVTPGWMVFGQGFCRSAFRRFTGRCVDLMTSTLLLVAALPLMLVTAIAIKLEDGWRAPVFYVQTRVGIHGHSFRLRKFRSMRADAESDGRPCWAVMNDRRVTRVGVWIRRYRIDELPQLFNVLQGDMSFVGPRPERPEIVAQLACNIPFYVQRHSVRPGLTGWAQVRYPYGASEEDAQQKLQYDLYYIKHNNLFLDLTIVLKTAEVVLTGRGAR